MRAVGDGPSKEQGGGPALPGISRRVLLHASAAAAVPLFARNADALPFGIGETQGSIGWGDAQKAGVQWGGGFSNPLSGGGDSFQAELVNGLGNPVIVNFKVPKGWKVSTNTGIAVQNYVTAESAFVLVAPAGTDDVEELDSKYVLDKVFDIRGRYGTFGKIDTIDVKKSKVAEEGKSTYKYIDFAFNSLTPGGREVERNGCIKVAIVDDDCIMLVASATSAKWRATKEAIASTVTSFVAVPAPKTTLKKSSIESGVGNKQALGVDGYDLLRYDSPIWRS